MSQYYITSNESNLSVSRFNEVLRNNPSSSVTLLTQPNSLLSDVGNKSYRYLFSQNITTLNKTPLKFSDFRNTAFVAANVLMTPETPSQYGTYNDGRLKITPYGGTGNAYSVKIAVEKSQQIQTGTISETKLVSKFIIKVGWRQVQEIVQTPVYSTVTKEVSVISDKTFYAGGNVQTNKDLETDIYAVTIKDLSSDLTVLNSYKSYIQVKYGGESESSVLYFSR